MNPVNYIRKHRSAINRYTKKLYQSQYNKSFIPSSCTALSVADTHVAQPNQHQPTSLLPPPPVDNARQCTTTQNDPLRRKTTHDEHHNHHNHPHTHTSAHTPPRSLTPSTTTTTIMPTTRSSTTTTGGKAKACHVTSRGRPRLEKTMEAREGR